MREIKILHNNPPAHKSKIVQEYLLKENMFIFPHPDHAPFDFLFTNFNVDQNLSLCLCVCP